MSYFPFFVNLQGEKCLVVGGGSVAYRKVCALLPFGVEIKVVAPGICRELEEVQRQDVPKMGQFQEKITVYRREYRESDLEDVLFVIAATDDPRCNQEVAGHCRGRKMFINVVDQPELCNFYFPSLMKQGDLVAGVCSGGKSPVLSSRIRKNLQQNIPGFYGQLNDRLGELRPWIKEHIHMESRRRQCYDALIRKSEQEGRALSQREMKEMSRGFADGGIYREENNQAKGDRP